MPMRATTVRFAEALWALVEREAERDGVSAAQFIRDATIMRAAYAMGQRGDDEWEAALGRAPAAPEDDGGPRRSQNGAERRQALLDAATAARDTDRVSALQATGLLDSDVDPAFDRHARLAAQVLNAPVALVSLVDADRQVFAGCVGLAEPWAEQRETPLSHSFCQHAVAAREPLLVTDARRDPVLHANLAIRDLGVIAYAGIPLIDPVGQALGTLCAIDHRPRAWTEEQVASLRDLAAAATDEIRLIALEEGGGA